MRRHKVSSKRSKRMFTRNAMKTHKKNTQANPMRGGYRL